MRLKEERVEDRWFPLKKLNIVYAPSIQFTCYLQVGLGYAGYER